MRIGTNNTERLRITSDGKVGIANASPAVALDITGEARSSTSTTSSSNAKTLTTKDYVDSKDIGVGQTWQNVAASRSTGTTYTNTTGKPIMLAINFSTAGAITVGGVLVGNFGVITGLRVSLYAIVPVDANYVVSIPNGGIVEGWSELR
jgi:hypothetical protein